MSISPNPHHALSEAEIDRIVEQQADDETAWEESIAVNRQPAFLVLPEDVAEKASFFASLYHADSVESWLVQIIQQRIALEESAFNKIEADQRNGMKASYSKGKNQ
ncbi:hypothetical protein XM38_052520 [Halomicronema hongdechloris C2206]|uniref:Uncharacterized protein n=1 Tax=Halomicronema hongdechloris C2206 TaxID=1641165 RepID=A0A1Z3HVP0_9CYAN|nr:hypothetical protein [Halomicronema hongdechloris]ASC74277.1 hypothetical protein XM38_052520 [Halomicronema hongdechloris C2206]